MALGLGALDREPVVVAARPVLEAEADAVGETVFLVSARAGRLVVLDKVEGTGFLRAAPRVGTSVPTHATAVGKLFLAFDPEALDPPDGRLERFTEHTPRSAGALAREVDRARERGFAENREQWIPGLAVVAAPIRSGAAGSGRGGLAGAIALAAPAPRYEELGPARLARRTRAAAERVEARLRGAAVDANGGGA